MSATLGRLWAVATLTVKEAVRRKTFLALILFAVALVSSMTFFSSVDDPVSKLRLIEVWSHRATIFFAALAAIFMGASSLPGDYEQKRIYVLASKPMHKVTFFLGKYLGFILVIALFLLIMGAISVAYLRIVKLAGGGMIPDLRARPRAWATQMHGVGSVDQNKQNPEVFRLEAIPTGTRVFGFATLDPPRLGDPIELRGSVTVRSHVPRWTCGSLRVEIRGPEKPFSTVVPIRHGDSFALPMPAEVVSCGRPLEVALSPASGDSILGVRDVRFHGSASEVRPVGSKNEGVVDSQTGEAYGCSPGAFRWVFPRLHPGDFPETISARLKLNVGGIRNTYRFSGVVRLVLETEDGSDRHEVEATVQSNEWTPANFPRRILESRKPVHVYVIPTDSDMRITGKRDLFVLFESDELFEWNYLKGLGLIFLWILVIMTVSFMFSSFLSAPISMLAGVVVLLVGALHEFVGEGVKDIDRSIAHARESERLGKPVRTPENLPSWALETSSRGSKIVLFLFPNAEKFDFSRFLLNDLAISVSDLWKALLEMLPRVAVIVLLGMLVMLFKDFG